MPNIRELDNPLNDLQPSEVGISSLEQEARLQRVDYNEAGNAIGSGIATAGNAIIGQLAKHQTMTEISQGAAQGNATWLNLTRAWNTAAAGTDPNDTGLQDRFINQTLEPALQKFQDSFSTEAGKKWALDYSDSLRNHFFEKTSADMSSRAVSAFTQNNGVTTNTAAAMVNADPTSLDAAIDQNHKTVDATVANSNLDADASGKATTDLKTANDRTIATAAFLGGIDKNPTQWLADQAAGKFDKYAGLFTPAEMQTFVTHANTVSKAGVEAAKAQETAIKQQQKSDYDTASTNLITSVFNPDGTVNGAQLSKAIIALPTQVGRLPGAAQDAGSSLKSNMTFLTKLSTEQSNGTNVRSDPSIYADAQDRATLPPDAPGRLSMGEVVDYYNKDLISKADFQKLSQVIRDRDADPAKAANNSDFNTYTKAMTPYIVTTPYGQPANSSQKMQSYQFNLDARKLFDAGIARGIPANQLLDRTNSNYILGKNEGTFLQKYQRPYDAYSQSPAPPEPAQQTEGSPALQPTGKFVNSGDQLKGFFTGGELGAAPGAPEFVQGLKGPTAGPDPKLKYDPTKFKSMADYAAFLATQGK